MSRLLFHVCCIRCKQSSYSSTLYHVPGIVYRNRGITYRIYCHGFVTLRVSRLELKTTVKYPPPQNHRALRPRWRGGHELPLDLLCAALSIADGTPGRCTMFPPANPLIWGSMMPGRSQIPPPPMGTVWELSIGPSRLSLCLLFLPVLGAISTNDLPVSIRQYVAATTRRVEVAARVGILAGRLLCITGMPLQYVRTRIQTKIVFSLCSWFYCTYE